MKIRSALIVGALLCSTAGKANYQFDPADLPDDFQCDAAPGTSECASQMRFEAWYQKYSNRVDYWRHVLLFDTNIYFAKDTYSLRELIDSPAYHDHEEWIGFRTPNLVDAFYSIALRRGDGWAFAINEQAMLRMVRRKSSDGLPQESVGKYAEWLPTTLAETAEQIAAEWVFEETDLTKCEGAVAYLRRFPAQQEHKLWDESSLIWSPEYLEKDKTDYIIVTADGDGVLVRAKGIADQRPVEKLVQPGYMIYNQWNGGAAYDWALQMERIVRPCLTVATVSPPWQMYLTASLGHQD